MLRILKRENEKEIPVRVKRINKDCWVDLEAPSDDEISLLFRRTEIPRDVILDCLDEDEVPRISSEQIRDGVVVIVRVPVYEGEKIFTIPLGIIITSDLFITVHSKPISFLQKFYDGGIDFSTKKKVRFLFQILRELIQEYTKILRLIEKRIRNIEKLFIQKARNEDILLLMEIKETVLDLQNAIHENNKVLEGILAGHHIKLYKGDVKIIADIIIDNRQCMTMSNFLIKNVNNALQTFEWIISNNLNIIMKRLTSLAMIISIPMIISSIYGMNILLPLQYHPYAFVILMLLSLVLCLIVAVYFAKKNWL